MVQERDLLNTPEFQGYMIANAERWLPVMRLLEHPTVVFDLGTNDFWTTISNSPKCNLILDQIASGDIIPVNADALKDIADVHTLLHVYIADSDRQIPIIPTIVNVNNESSFIENYQLPREIPGVYVKKFSFRDGKMTAHRGEGVKIVRVTEENLGHHLPKNRWEFLQPFVIPPDRFVRDIRVYLVGGQPVAGLIRRAREPLHQKNLSGRELPTQFQYPSAQCPGPNEPLTGKLRDRVFSLAQEIGLVLDEKVRSRSRPYSPFSTFGFGSVDFLLDTNRTPLPVDFDVNPSVSNFKDIPRRVARAMAKFLCRLADEEAKERRVLLMGPKHGQFLNLVLKGLGTRLPSQRVFFQERIVDQALREFADASGI